MLQYQNGDTILLATKPIDFRKGARSLLSLCRNSLAMAPKLRTWFVFANRKRTAVKILAIDATGCWLAIKYFDKGTLAFWPKPDLDVVSISSKQLTLLTEQRLG